MTAPDEALPNNRPINRDQGVWPTSGPIAGGTTVTVTGSDLTGTSAVTFGGIPGTSITVVNPTVVSVVTPEKSAGIVDVVLTTPAGSITSADAYTFVKAPTAEPISSTLTPIQEFMKSTRGTIGRLVRPLKVEKLPKVKATAPKPKASVPQRNREFVLLVHDATVKKPTAAINIPPVPDPQELTKQKSIKRSDQTALIEPKNSGDENSVMPPVEVTPLADVVETPIVPIPKRRIRKPALIDTAVIPSTSRGPSTVDDYAAAGPTEPNFFALAAIHESGDKARDTIGRRVRKSIAAVIGLLIIVASIDGYAVSVVTRQSNRLESEYREMTAANQNVLVSAVASDLAIRSYLLSGDRTYLDKFEVVRPQLVAAIADLESVAVKVGDEGLLQLANNSSSIVELWLRTFVDRTMVIASADTPRGDQLAGAELINNLRGASTSIANYISDVNDEAVVVANRVRRQTITIAALVLVVAFMVIAVLLILGGSDISFPLINLSRVVNRIYRGEHKARADDTAGPAEIRAVSRAVNELAYQQETAHEWVTQFNLSKTNFLNTVNHELRTPLTSITGYSELLGEDSELTNLERNRMATVINRNAFRLNDLIDNMLTVLRIDAMEVRFKMSTFDIRNVVSESIESFRATAESRELTIVSELGDDPFTVWADENEILRVVSNLISNAVKFSNPGGQIEVAARLVLANSGKREVAVSVTDTGIGIIDAELQHVGSRFYRSSNAIDAAIPGTGIGLMIVGFIVHEHGGTWSLTSTESVGTRVEIRLPLTSSAMSLEVTSGSSAT